MARAKKGDREAFTLLVNRHIDRLYGYALSLTQAATTAEDLVQETWLAAWQRAASFNPRKASVGTWLHRILHNKFIDMARKPQLLRQEGAVAAIADAYDAEQNHAQMQQMAKLNSLIHNLPTNQKAAIVLTYTQGFSNREVAHILGLGLRAAESLLARARNTLKQGFEKTSFPAAPYASSEEVSSH